MAGEQKRKEREALITKALLLGYEFKWGVFSPKACYMLKPNGMYHSEDMPLTIKGTPRSFIKRPKAYHSVYVAAIEALKLSGVYDAAVPRRDLGAGSGKNFRLRGRRRKRGGTGRFFEGAKSGS